MKIITTFIVFLFGSTLSAQTLSEAVVVQSSLEHYPKVIQSLLRFAETEAREKEALGAFDGKILAEVDRPTDGYYRGRSYGGQVEKPLYYMNSKIFSGYRISKGDFPVYDGKQETLSRGESFLGLSLSLLRSSFIDGYRYKSRMVEQEKRQARLDADQVKMEVQTLALQSYWTWVAKGEELKVYEELLSLAEKRVQGLNRRVRSGDLAPIYQAENEQYILKRKVDLKRVEAEFQQAGFYLSLFYRDNRGKTLPVSRAQLPKERPALEHLIPSLTEPYEKSVKRSLSLRKMESQLLQAQTTKEQGTNLLLPKLDLKAEWSRDHGVGPERLAPDEGRVMVNLEIPLEFRKGEGLRQQGLRQMESLKSQMQLEKEKLKAEVESLLFKIKNNRQIYEFSKDQVNLARKLVVAERKKFQRGASDLILLNLREENLAQTRVKNIEAYLKQQYFLAEIRQLTLEFL
ncbi:MAG: TolC family protein [Bdellovibrionales bacterium]|nr:TolC family protein [Bdellovibrionales bacterium]